MTVYNHKYRCEGGQKLPVMIIASSAGPLGRCSKCDKYFKMYPNGKVVMHKRPITRSTNAELESRSRQRTKAKR